MQVGKFRTTRMGTPRSPLPASIRRVRHGYHQPLPLEALAREVLGSKSYENRPVTAEALKLAKDLTEKAGRA